MASSCWYSDPEVLLEQVRLTVPGRQADPAIPGYDDLVEIRRGGQGIVYAATQRSTRRRVAIKLLLDGAYASDVARRRFEREIDLVATLRNPHIVRIYDSGVSGEGRPYFVMEYVDGAPLDRYAAEAGLTATDNRDASAANQASRVNRLLRLFLPICEAVQYAHQRGVIHRDIKPGNIRVDSDGAPRVLDFGLAKISDRWSALSGETAREASSATENNPPALDAFTQSGQFLGSLPWASPEHASGKPDAIDTRSDVYSLGVVLYHLLTGRFPYAVDGALRDTFDNIAKAEPARPSSIAAGIDDDVETIVLTCLAKDPARRFQSAGEVAADIRHYLEGEPIQARRDSAWYTLRKTLRRYQVAAAAGGAIGLVVLAGFVVSLRLWQAAERERKRADTERDAAVDARASADVQTEQARAANKFLVDMLSAVDPEVSGRDVRVADVLDRSAAEVDDDLKDQPATATAVHTAIGQSYLALGLLDKADEQLAGAVELAHANLSPDSREAILAIQWLGQLRYEQGRYDEAESLMRDAIDACGRAYGPDADMTQVSEQNLAQLMRDQGHWEEAEAATRKIMEARQRTLGLENRKTLLSMHQLASIYSEQGRLADAKALFEQIIEVETRVLGDTHPNTIASIVELGHTLGELGELEASEAEHRHGYDLYVKVYGDEHPKTLMALHDVGIALVRQQKNDEAIAIFQQVLDGQLRLLKPENPQVLNTRESLATALQAARRLEEAEPLYREAAETAERILGKAHATTIVYVGNHAMNLLRLRRYAEAEPLLRQNYETALSTLGEKHWKTAVFRGNLGRAYILQERYDETEPHFLGSYEVLQEVLGPNHGYTQAAAGDLVELYEAWGKPERAEQYRQAAAPAGQP